MHSFSILHLISVRVIYSYLNASTGFLVAHGSLVPGSSSLSIMQFPKQVIRSGQKSIIQPLNLLGEVFQAESGKYPYYSLFLSHKLIDMQLTDRITIEPGKRGGKPCIRGLRITVYEVLEYLASGMSFDEVLEDFPYLQKEDILACLSFAANKEKIELCA